VEEEDVVPAHLVAHLAHGLEEGQRLNVADGPADLGDDDVDLGAGHAADARLDLVGDVRDDLHRVAEVLTASLLRDDGRIHLAGRHIGRAVEIGVEEALVVTDVEIGLGAVVGDEDLSVLEGVHRARVDIEIGIELLHRHAQSARLEEVAEAGCRQALAEGRRDAAGDEHMTGVPSLLHGRSGYQRPEPRLRERPAASLSEARARSSSAWAAAVAESSWPPSIRASSVTRAAPSA